MELFFFSKNAGELRIIILRSEKWERTHTTHPGPAKKATPHTHTNSRQTPLNSLILRIQARPCLNQRATNTSIRNLTFWMGGSQEGNSSSPSHRPKFSLFSSNDQGSCNIRGCSIENTPVAMSPYSPCPKNYERIDSLQNCVTSSNVFKSSSRLWLPWDRPDD